LQTLLSFFIKKVIYSWTTLGLNKEYKFVKGLSSDQVNSLIEHEGLGESVCNAFKGQSGKMLVLLGNLNDEHAKSELKRRGLWACIRGKAFVRC
jgi:hypothetical protein